MYRTGVVSAVAVCVCVALMALAPLARAEGNWRTGLKSFTATKSFTGVPDTTLDVLVELSSTSRVEMICSGFSIDSGFLYVEGKSSGQLLLSSCKAHVTLGGVLIEEKLCHPQEPVSGKVLGHLVLHNEATYEVLEPGEIGEEGEEVKGSKVLTFFFGESCPLGEEMPIKGSLAIRDCNAAFETELIEHLVEEVPRGLFAEHVLAFGTHPAAIDGSVKLKLSGPNAGEQWSGVG